MKNFIAGVLRRFAYRLPSRGDKSVLMCHLLIDRKVPQEIEADDLAHLSTNALATYQTEVEVAAASDFVAGSALTTYVAHIEINKYAVQPMPLSGRL